MEIIGKTEATRAAEIRLRLFARSLNGGNERNVRSPHRTSDRAELIRDALVSIRRRLHRKDPPRSKCYKSRSLRTSARSALLRNSGDIGSTAMRN